MTLPEVAALLGLNLALIVAAALGLWGLSLRLKDVGFVDGAWPLGMLFLALATFPRTEGDPVRKGLLLWLCAVWAIWLGWRLLLRWRETGGDRRYARIIEAQRREQGWSFRRTALLLVFLPHAVLAWLVGLPVQLGQVGPTPMGWIGWIGALIVVAGIALENIGAAQLAAFRRDPAHADRTPDTGLWRRVRNPGYVGDACVWWGLWLIAAETGWVGAASIAGPVVLTFTLMRWSGWPIKSTATSKPK
jgi:steroid 5-alpha reductase family enzyme